MLTFEFLFFFAISTFQLACWRKKTQTTKWVGENDVTVKPKKETQQLKVLAFFFYFFFFFKINQIYEMGKEIVINNRWYNCQY